MFLTDIKAIIEKTQSPIRRPAIDSCREQADTLSEKAGLVHHSSLKDILFNDVVPEGSFYSSLQDGEDYRFSARIGHYIDECEKTGQWPSLTALVYQSIEQFGLDMNEAQTKAMLTSASLGEIHNNQPFHGNEHYRKVLLATMRQIHKHNQIYKGTEWELEARDVALLVTAANIHDFMHDGQPNGEIPSRLEKQSYELAAPFLKSAGVDDDFLADLKTIILATDVTPPGEPQAPANQMKEAYKFYFAGKEGKPDLDEGLSRLHDNPRLCLLAALFQEADVLPSVAFGYQRGVKENIKVAEEGDKTPSPNFMLFFLDNIFGEFITEAGRKNQIAFLETKKLYDADLKNGIADYNVAGATGVFQTRPYPPFRLDKK
jgi:hypothetical protein